MPEVELSVRNPSGLHARPAAAFVRAATRYAARIRITNLDGQTAREADAKSVLAVIGIGAARGDRVRISADGGDADDALRELTRQMEAGLGERIEDREPA